MNPLIHLGAQPFDRGPGAGEEGRRVTPDGPAGGRLCGISRAAEEKADVDGSETLFINRRDRKLDKHLDVKERAKA